MSNSPVGDLPEAEVPHDVRAGLERLFETARGLLSNDGLVAAYAAAALRCVSGA